MNKREKISSFTLIVSFLCIALAGLAFLPLLPVKLVPSRNLPGLSINFGMSGNSSRLVEIEATSKLESMLARLGSVKKITSYSGNGWGRIDLELDKHADIDVVRLEASAIIRQIWPQMPESVTFPTIELERPDENEERPFLTYTLNAAAAPNIIRQYAENYIRPTLAQCPGIYEVEITGATQMEWCLEYDKQQLEYLEITVEDVKNAVAAYLDTEFLGYGISCSLGKKSEWIRISLNSAKEVSEFDLSQIKITCKSGRVIGLGELVKISHREEVPQSYYRINGLNSIYVSLIADKNANQLDVSSRVKKEMERIEEQLPAGYRIETGYDATEYIHGELHKIYFRTALTVLILLFFILLVTLSVRYLLLVIISLLVNISIAVGLYYFSGVEIQLYSLTGITISLNLIIDNTIVMADHIRHHGNRKAILSILAATLTTIGALSVIFFLDENIRLNLEDFAYVVIINLVVSILVALFFVPSLMEKIKAEKRIINFPGRYLFKRMTVVFNHMYRKQIVFFYRWRFFSCLVLILAFGLPVFILPEKIESDNIFAQTYNRIASDPLYTGQVKPVLEKLFGGTLRLFVKDVYEGSYLSRPEETVLSVAATLPNGATLLQMDHLVRQMERYLTGFEGIRQFQTSIYNARQAVINIYFTPEEQHSGFPYQLKANIINRALELGGGSWSVWGLADQGFSNNLNEIAGSYRIVLYGYNYEELYFWADKLKNRLLENQRIKEVSVSSDFSFWKNDYQEFYFDLDKENLARRGIQPMQLFSALNSAFGRDILCGEVLSKNGIEKLKLSSRQSEKFDIWNIQNTPLLIDGKNFKLSEIVRLSKIQFPQQIVKENQQYRLCLQYEYIGVAKQGKKITEQIVADFENALPMGYSVIYEDLSGQWNKENKSQYWLLLLIICIIFFITSILFNSLRQPFVVIFLIPISYIGLFLTFYCFGLNFDQGGFAAFVLLCGITVNSSIYILNEYNTLRRKEPHITPLRAYIKAWNLKITPVLLTVLSTILGFIPFLIGEGKEAFWFPLAAGTIGGLLMSLIALFFYLPLFIGIKDMKKTDGNNQSIL
ncbi:MAG: efflux RND transporter permease subunit [Bacteroidales bacterium]|nr:efflux RND transporter permease subunit [Bacteroidales bacterium]